MYAIRYETYDKAGRATVRERTFATMEARERFADRLVQRGQQIIAWGQPPQNGA